MHDQPDHPNASPRAGTPKRILISGASGFLGTHLHQYLARRDYQVTQLVRRTPDSPGNQIQWDPHTGQLDCTKLSGFDAVINLSGENIATRWNSAFKQRIRDSRVKPTRLLAEAIAAVQPRPQTFICASAIGYYGHRENEVLTEAAPPGNGFLSGVCREWEAAADPARTAGVRVVNLRIGVVLSPSGGALATMLPVFRKGMGAVIGSGHQWLSWIALSDLMRVFDFVLTHPKLSGPVNAVSPKPVTNRDMTKTLGGLLNRPTFVPMPAAAVRLTLGEMGVETLLASAKIVPERLESAGFRFEYPDLKQALQHELQIAR